MKSIFRIAILFIFIQSGLSLTAHSQDPLYPSWNQITDSLERLQQRFENIAAVRTIGTTTHKDYKILGLEITGDIKNKADKPVWVFTGVIHGTEKLGLRLLLDLAHELTEGYASNPNIKKWVDAYDIWLIPAANPTGYMENRRGNGIRTDDETSGVDLNRNFDFRWKEGGSTKTKRYDYRGTAPASENETQAMQNLYLKLRPMFGLTFHQGNNPDGGQVMVPWRQTKDGLIAPPDATVLYHYANLYADWVFHSRKKGNLCKVNNNGDFVLEDPKGTACGTLLDSAQFCKELCWRPFVTDLGAIGQSSNYYYASAGAIDFTMELSDRIFRRMLKKSSMDRANPPANKRDSTVLAIIEEIKENNMDAIKKWFDYFLISAKNGYYQYRGPGITGHITDKNTQQPVQANIDIVGFKNPLTKKLQSNANFGRYWKLLPTSGKYEIIVHADGYKEQKALVDVNEGALTNLNIALTPIK